MIWRCVDSMGRLVEVKSSEMNKAIQSSSVTQVSPEIVIFRDMYFVYGLTPERQLENAKRTSDRVLVNALTKEIEDLHGWNEAIDELRRVLNS